MSSLGSGSLSRIHNKFRSASSNVTDTGNQVPNITLQGGKNYNEPKKYGIISAEEWKRQAFPSAEASSGAQSTATATESDRKKKKKKKTVVSFSFEEEEAEDPDINFVKPAQKRRKITKCKDADIETEFLPDAEREKEEEEQRQKTRQEWLRRQEIMKNEVLEITYSYWDGSGHRKKIQMKKKSTILDFLNAACNDLRDKYRELRFLQGINLLYIKEDVILPHDLTFYELIITKARGLTGPLFHFDVHEDIRLKGNAKIDKDDSHPGKIVTQKWYQRNKHIHPYSRWVYYMRS